MLKHLGLGPRLVLLALLTSAPLVALVFTDAQIEQREAIKQTEAEALSLAHQAVNRHAELVHEARTLLEVLAEVPAVRNGVTARKCAQCTLDANGPGTHPPAPVAELPSAS